MRMLPANVVAVAVATAVVVAQAPALTPSSSLTIDASATQGVLTYSLINIPVGVTVTYTGSYPIQIRCAGDAIIDGAIGVGAAGSTAGPGAVATGAGSPGTQYNSFLCGGWNTYAGNGVHAGVYGSTLPFSLAGGSPGGDVSVYGQSGIFSQCGYLYSYAGGGGGGTLVIDADGVVDVAGTVDANGGLSFYAGSGSGGSILLRGRSGLTVRPSGNVLARPGWWLGSAPGQAHGYVRLDAYGQAPMVLGVVDPPPDVVRQPLLIETQPPTIGSSWDLQVVAPAGDGVFLAASFQPGNYTGPYGTVGIDVYSAITFGFVTLPAVGHDPISAFQLPVPNNPTFVGLNLWTAGLDWYTPLPPRYSNTIQSVVQ